MSPASIVDDLRCDLAEGRVTVVVGAGVSVAATIDANDTARNASVASWLGLLQSGIDECVKIAQPLPNGWADRLRDEIASGDRDDLLSAAEKISSKLGAPTGGAYGNWLRETVGALRIRDSELPRAISNLRVPILTTNYDGILEDATGRPALTWRESGLVERVIRGDEPGIVHIHGYWRQPDTVVLGIRSYENVLRDPHAQAMLRSLRVMKSLLFVGFGAGLDDPNFGAFLRWSRETLRSSHYKHYRLERNANAKTCQEQHHDDRVYVVPYGEEFSDLAPFVASLREGTNQVIATTGNAHTKLDESAINCASSLRQLMPARAPAGTSSPVESNGRGWRPSKTFYVTTTLAVAAIVGSGFAFLSERHGSHSALGVINSGKYPELDGGSCPQKGTILREEGRDGLHRREVANGSCGTIWEVKPVSDCSNYQTSWVTERDRRIPSDVVKPHDGACPRGMAAVLGGTFSLREKSQDPVTVQTFCLDLTEVTSAAFEACTRMVDPSKRCQSPKELQCDDFATFRSVTKRNHPMNCVTWTEAAQYCRSKGKRLPTEEEWEWAARGQDNACDYPWGKVPPGSSRACWWPVAGGKGTCPVESFPAGDAPGGFHDLSGNVNEFTDSLLREPPEPVYHVFRGGSWNCKEGDIPPCMPVFRRFGMREGDRSSKVGFRCAL